MGSESVTKEEAVQGHIVHSNPGELFSLNDCCLEGSSGDDVDQAE